MSTKSIKEKKPFRLVKFFTFSSLIVMFAATIVISAMNAHWVRNILQQKSEEYAHLLVENLNHQVFLQFILPTFLKDGKIKLREKQQYERMDRVVKSTLHSFNVEMVNIYNMKNAIVYSLDTKKIGVKDADSKGYAQAIQNNFSSRLIQKGNAIELFFGFPHKTQITTFAPLRAEKPFSAVLGVFEITQDISEDYRKIFQLQLLTVVTCCLVMGILFVILIFVVKQGESIIETRARERLKLEEKLQRAEHLSDIGEMTAGVSHEIRNPLGIIKSSAELLKKKMTKLGQPTTIIDIIVEESIRLDHIIKDFLDFAKPMTPVLKPCRIDELIEKNIHYLSQQISDNNITIERNFSTSIPEIMADSEKLYQAFLNIFLNSFQAMPQCGEIMISIDTKLNGKYPAVTLLFEDNGTGVSKEVLKKIWTPFFTTKDTGTGLGLGIVKNIIESHQGEIEIFNRKTGGATVKLTLPYQGEK